MRAAPPILPATSGQLPTTMGLVYKVLSLQKGYNSLPVGLEARGSRGGNMALKLLGSPQEALIVSPAPQGPGACLHLHLALHLEMFTGNWCLLPFEKTHCMLPT